jgi:hypothetical protein
MIRIRAFLLIVVTILLSTQLIWTEVGHRLAPSWSKRWRSRAVSAPMWRGSKAPRAA